jgi:hypothetical protein
MKRISMTAALMLVLFAMIAMPANVMASDNFVASLSGGQEVPARDTNATGVATFKFNKDGSAFRYKLIVANIENVFAAHIHCAAAGVNGPIGVTLFMGSPASGHVDGVLAQATVTAPNPGNACGWTTVADVLAAIESGDTYVNVHTNDGVGDANTGPGDFASGELRGQIH